MLCADSQGLPWSQEAQLWGDKNQRSHVLAVDAAGSIPKSEVTPKAALCETNSDIANTKDRGMHYTPHYTHRHPVVYHRARDRRVPLGLLLIGLQLHHRQALAQHRRHLMPVLNLQRALPLQMGRAVSR